MNNKQYLSINKKFRKLSLRLNKQKIKYWNRLKNKNLNMNSKQISKIMN